MSVVFAELTCNLSSTKKVRRETLDGKAYLVAPAVLHTHGVHFGANDNIKGGIYYSEDELSNIPSRWDHKPIVVNHPQKDGKRVSACDPAVLEKYGCGFFLNTRYDSKLRTELWFDEEKTKAVDPRVHTKLENEEMMELSTGLYMDVEMTAGEYNGKPYVGIARNFAPDHVAILPDSVGANSIKDGAGVLQLNESGEKTFLPITTNDTSYQRISSALSDALEKVLGYYAYIRDVYDGFLIYMDGNRNLFKKSYSVDKDGKVTLGEDATSVKWVTEYRTMGGQFVGNTSIKESDVADKKKTYIDALITNQCGYEEADRPTLEKWDEAKLKNIHDVVVKAKSAAVVTPITTNDAVPAPTPPPVVTPPLTTPPPPVTKVPTLAEYITNAPPEFRHVIQDGIQKVNQERAELITGITQNPNNRLTAEFLNNQDMDVLRGIAAVAVPPKAAPAPNYMGQAVLATNSGGKPQEPLGAVDYEWTKK